MRPLPIPLRDHDCIENSAYDEWANEIVCGICNAVLAAPFRVIVCGSRYWTEPEPIRNVIRWVATNGRSSVVIHGGAPGADTLAGFIAQSEGLNVLTFPADWERWGKRAGPIRNTQMLASGRPEMVFGFTNDLTQSRGTADMLRKAAAARIPAYVINDQNHATAVMNC